MRGRGKNSAHKAKNPEEDEPTVPRLSMDYMFMSKKDEEEKVNPIIVMVDEGTGEKYSRATGQKGIGQDGEMDWLIKDMHELGIGELKELVHAGHVHWICSTSTIADK